MRRLISVLTQGANLNETFLLNQRDYYIARTLQWVQNPTDFAFAIALGRISVLGTWRLVPVNFSHFDSGNAIAIMSKVEKGLLTSGTIQGVKL